MTEQRNTPQIAPANLSVAGAPIELVAYVDPDQFPNNMELIVMRPGSLEPLGKILVRKGCMIGVVPPEVAQHLLAAAKQAAANGPGQVRAPGL